LCRCDIDSAGTVREIVRRRGDHTADMEDVVGASYSTEDVVVFVEVAPDNINTVSKRGEKFVIFFAISCEDSYAEAVRARHKLLESGEAHVASGSGYEYSFHRFFWGLQIWVQRYDFFCNLE